MHYYKRNIGDYAKKAGRLTMLQHGAYTLILDACYDRERFPTLEEAIEWTWASTEAEVEAVKFVLQRFFQLDKDNQYVQERVLEELLQYHKNADTNKRIAIEREAKRKEKSTNRVQAVNELPPNHKPLTINQEPITKNHKDSVSKDTGVASDRENIFAYGLPLLVNSGIPEKQARSFFGKLIKDHGDQVVANTLRDCFRAKPLQPLEWLMAALNGPTRLQMNKQEALEASNLEIARRASERFLNEQA